MRERDPFDVYKVERTHSSAQIVKGFEELEGKEVKVAGRLMLREVKEKYCFLTFMIGMENFNYFVKIDAVGEEALKEFKSLRSGRLDCSNRNSF